jgi:hypothetical protein
MPIPRKSLVSVDTTPSYHVVSRCVRRTFLFGIVDSKDFSHRRDAIVTRLAGGKPRWETGHPPIPHKNLTLTFLQPNLKLQKFELSGRHHAQTAEATNQCGRNTLLPLSQPLRAPGIFMRYVRNL